MRITVVGEYVRAVPWSASRWAVDVSRWLLARGHEVRLIADGVEELEELEGLKRSFARSGGFEYEVMRPRRTHRATDPEPFAAWAEERFAARGEERWVSFTPKVAGDVMVKVEPGAMEALRAELASMSVVSAGMAMLDHRYLVSALRCERRAERQRRACGGIVARVGDENGARSASLGFASALASMEAGERAMVRERVRGVLGVPLGATVVVMSTTHVAGRGRLLRSVRARGVGQDSCAASMLGLAALGRERGGAPFVIVMGRRPASLEALAERAGVLDRVRFAGSHVDRRAVLAACDLAVATGGGGSGGGSGRFIADALRMGAPVVAGAGVGGTTLLASMGPGLATGLVVGASRAEAWREAFREALRESWLSSARVAAERLGASLGGEAFVVGLEGLMAREGSRASSERGIRA